MSKFIECIETSTNLEVYINVDNILYVGKDATDKNTAIFIFLDKTIRPLMVKGSYSEIINKISNNNLSK